MQLRGLALWYNQPVLPALWCSQARWLALADDGALTLYGPLAQPLLRQHRV
jgi:hypothetical protein